MQVQLGRKVIRIAIDNLVEPEITIDVGLLNNKQKVIATTSISSKKYYSENPIQLTEGIVNSIKDLFSQIEKSYLQEDFINA